MVGLLLFKDVLYVFQISFLLVDIDLNYLYLLFVKTCVNLISYIEKFPYGMLYHSRVLILI